MHPNEEQLFNFDEIFDEHASQTDIFEKVSRKSLNDVL